MYFYCYDYIFLLYVYALLPLLRFFVFFPQLQGKCQGIARKDGALPALFQNFCVVLYIVFFLCHAMYCLCVNVYCTAATGWLPNCS